ncbi:MAG: L-glutamate gamma-semialdehyde dehydrogenase [Candidatus Marinimicrobia bacterium]|nr:L-glutamate gamma-semialdehyde dehydrogenase [Candidatus Neomarinimicrobiota bacterium]MBL7059402.1 L-glutamate gamma-semialdehyde dehydrogenase [Candidatus Neomarinimicrobiota bacterium]
MPNKIVTVPIAGNEPIKSYAPRSPEKESLKSKITELKSTQIEIPLIIGGKEIKTGNTATCVIPHDHQHVLATYHLAGESEVQTAIEASQKSWESWSTTPWEHRVAIFKKMATLLAGPYRDLLNAATMLNVSKNAFQAEIDSACELIDFFNFNAEYAQEIYEQQPLYSPAGMWNQVEHRPLEGFVFAVTPFNFVSIAGNLPTAPVLMGNVVLWKPASSAVYPAYFLMKLFKEAGLPDGVINFIPGPGSKIGPNVMKSEILAGVHFTGSTAVFQNMWKTIGNNIQNYKSYPRIVGETGGKDFCIAHETADVDGLVTAMVRGAFEYQGQKCSALSRAYVPSTLWDEIKEKYLNDISTITVGDPLDFTHFMNAVIDKPAFDSIRRYIDYAKTAKDAEIITGGNYDDSTGYFIEPTTIVTTNPHFKTMEEEIFGPVLTIYVYDPKDWKDTLRLVDSTSPYALTGAVFANNREAVIEASDALTHAAGNFYINDKPTGAVVGQQPFGGGRASGTNDKAGSMFNLIRWISQRTIKETFDPPKDYRYPFMSEE